MITPIISDENQPNINFEELLDRSHFKDYLIKKRFAMMDVEPVHRLYGYTYYFNILSKSNLDDNTGKNVENEFYFDMYYYNRQYPEESVGNTIDLTLSEIPMKAEIKSHLATSIKIPNNFYKAEVNITQNDCLTLFIFLDSEEETKFTLFPERHDVYFDMRQSKANNFSIAVKSFYGHPKESFDLVYNDLNYKEDLFLKVICPYFSSFGNDQISMDIKLIPEGYSFDGKLI